MENLGWSLSQYCIIESRTPTEIGIALEARWEFVTGSIVLVSLLTKCVEHGGRGELLVPNRSHVSEVDLAAHSDEDHLQRAGSEKVELVGFLERVEGADAAGEFQAAEEGVDLGICPKAPHLVLERKGLKILKRSLWG